MRRTEDCARGRYADVRKPEDGSGTADIEARLLATDADALDQRLDAMARAVCDADPRTLDQRRSDALGAIGHGADRLSCQCEQARLPRRRHAAQRRGRARRRPRRLPVR